jgi:ABC-type branched-subunit amino acid transport system ATPase component
VSGGATSHFPYLGRRGWTPLVGVAAVFSGVGAFAATLVLFRPELQIDLELASGDYEVALGMTAGLAAFGALGSTFVVSDKGSRRLLQGLALVVAGVFALLGAVNEAGALTLLLAIAAVGIGGLAAQARIAAVDIYGSAGGWRVIAVPWAGIFAGIAGVSAYGAIASFANWGFGLAGAGAIVFLGVAVVPPSRTVPDAFAQRGSRSQVMLTGVALSFAVLGTAPTAMRLLAEEWDLDTGGRSAVLMVAGLGGAVIALLGHWYHHLANKSARHLSAVAQSAALVAGGLMFLGGVSTTLIGLIVCWGGAAVATAFFAICFDNATLIGRPLRDRHTFGGLAALAAISGGGIVILGLGFADSIDPQWQIAIVTLPVVVVTAMALLGERDVAPAADQATASGVPASPVDHVPAGPEPLLSCREIEVSYEGVQVLFGVDLDVAQGEAVALLGTNGAGKTTLLRTISGLVAQDAGSIRFGGVDISDFDPTWRVELGLIQIADGAAVAGDLTVAENLRLAAHSLGRNSSALNERLDRAYEQFPRMAERRSQAASTLSGGEKQMLALSKAMILEPSLLIIDEFSLGLAPLVVAELLPVVERINQAGTAVLIVEQSVNVALSIADQASVIEKGEIVRSGPAAELRDDPDLMRTVYLEGVTKALTGS